MWKMSVAQSCPTLTLPHPRTMYPTSFLCPWDSPGKNTGVGGLSLLQGLFPTQASNLGLPHCSRHSTIWGTRETPSPRKNNSDWEEAPQVWLDSWSVCVLMGKSHQGEEHQDVTFNTEVKNRNLRGEGGTHPLFLYSHLSMKLSKLRPLCKYCHRSQGNKICG